MLGCLVEGGVGFPGGHLGLQKAGTPGSNGALVPSGMVAHVHSFLWSSICSISAPML